MNVVLPTQSIKAASIAHAKLVDLNTEVLKAMPVMVNAVNTAWTISYGLNKPYGIEITLMNGDLTCIGYSTTSDQQHDWAIIQGAVSHFGTVIRSTPKKKAK